MGQGDWYQPGVFAQRGRGPVQDDLAYRRYSIPPNLIGQQEPYGGAGVPGPQAQPGTFMGMSHANAATMGQGLMGIAMGLLSQRRGENIGHGLARGIGFATQRVKESRTKQDEDELRDYWGRKAEAERDPQRREQYEMLSRMRGKQLNTIGAAFAQNEAQEQSAWARHRSSQEGMDLRAEAQQKASYGQMERQQQMIAERQPGAMTPEQMQAEDDRKVALAGRVTGARQAAQGKTGDAEWREYIGMVRTAASGRSPAERSKALKWLGVENPTAKMMADLHQDNLMKSYITGRQAETLYPGTPPGAGTGLPPVQ